MSNTSQESFISEYLSSLCLEIINTMKEEIMYSAVVLLFSPGITGLGASCFCQAVDRLRLIEVNTSD